MNSIIDELTEFIDKAEGDRKYAPNTATGYRVALGLFEKELNDKESEDLQELKNHLEAIYQNVCRNNKKFKSSTLEEYKKRIKKIILDFETYGNDPSKMVAWTPTKRKAYSRSKSKEEIIKNDSEQNNSLSGTPKREVGSLSERW